MERGKQGNKGRQGGSRRGSQLPHFETAIKSSNVGDIGSKPGISPLYPNASQFHSYFLRFLDAHGLTAGRVGYCMVPARRTVTGDRLRICPRVARYKLKGCKQRRTSRQHILCLLALSSPLPQADTYGVATSPLRACNHSAVYSRTQICVARRHR
eukprot:6199070-Pleurochrysis_carterae.AAC.1